VESDPLASIRDEIAGRNPTARPDGPVGPPAPSGPAAVGAMQVGGYLIGWASIIAVLPYGLIRALWLYASGRDLRGIGAED
jgi:hypothetical protein